jgi:hypothetical protein
MLRLIIAGSRGVENYSIVVEAAEVFCLCYGKPDAVLSGGAYGVDQLGEEWANAKGVPLEVYPADWALHGRKAGTMRNSFMARKANALLAVWDGSSNGTRHMIETARRKGFTVMVWRA